MNDQTNDNPWKTLSRTTIYQNPWLTLYEDKVINPGGVEGIYSVIDAKDGILLIAEDDAQNVYIMESYRYPVQKWVWELPSGGIDAGDTPQECAQKELKEELGMTSDAWTKIGEFSPSYSGAMVDRQHIFVAQNVQIGEHERESGEAIRTVKKVSRAELFKLIEDGTIEDGQTLAALLRYTLWCQREAR
jgi:8-oxo-dGTP pyrophosphatase MutT (NUDIX family)